MLNYLLSPEFQIVNTAGKPCTGYLEVFIHGSREHYYCASDWNGTLYPFQVPLDSLGGNVVLADDSNAYDVYIYNRYGSLLMSRYNVHPSSGGFGGIITSSDGTITVTQIDGGWDLSVTGGKAGTLKAGADSLSSDGYFSFVKKEGQGDAIYMDNDGHIFLEDGWFHFSATVKLTWDGVENPQCGPIRLNSGLTYDIIDFDFSYNHVDTVVLDGDIYIGPRSSQYISFGRGFSLSVTGMQQGMTAELVDCDIHTIMGQGGVGKDYTASTGIIISDEDEISIDTLVVATKTDLESKQDVLTAGDNITIEDNVISSTASSQVQSDWTESNTDSVSYIKHKPAETPLIPGSNITFTETSQGLVISATGGGGGSVVIGYVDL